MGHGIYLLYTMAYSNVDGQIVEDLETELNIRTKVRMGHVGIGTFIFCEESFAAFI